MLIPGTRVRVADSVYDRMPLQTVAAFKGLAGVVKNVNTPRRHTGDNTPVYAVELDVQMHGMRVWSFYGEELEEA